ncbi:PAS domain S-box protein [Candidatus Accumulibacter sp. ACC003]|uniref:PAS domain-containing sensor histidine kinase n=1 Tax=Candidatus Accumulibacter sp. ACC003 TaxID=2823334 RepID=UPI0025BCA318|nr:PAS domain S-box protein [Candidatus Accumulibacter sp. ACC003]
MTADAHPPQVSLHEEETILGLFSAIPDGLLVLDLSGCVLYANDTAQHMFGGRSLIGENLGLPLTLGSRHVEIEYIDGAGHIGMAEMRSSRFEWLGQAAIAVSLRDTTVRRALLDEMALDRQVFESIQEGIVVTRPDGVIVRVNHAFEVITGYSAADVLGMTPRLLKSDQQDAAFYDEMWQSIVERGSWRGEVVNRHRDGSLYPALLAISKIHDADGALTHLVGAYTDLTKHKKHQEELAAAHTQLLHAEKMAAIGQLAAGVAHEVNNPLGFVLSNLEMLGEYTMKLLRLVDAYEEDSSRSSEGAARIEEIKGEIAYAALRKDVMALLGESREGLERVRRIVLDLRDFSRPGDSNWQWCDLHQGLESTLNIVWNEIKYKSKVDKRYGKLPEIYCIPPQINQVLMNLLVNAAQAIEGYGRITISTACDAETVWIEIHNTGQGIAPEDLPHVFEPFFTTKPVGQGTGLGLSLSFGIVQRHHGRIEVRSDVAEGCCFRVTLPINCAAVDPLPAAT